MKKAKLFLTGAVIAVIAVGAVAAKAKSARNQGNLYYCTGTPLTCQFTGDLSSQIGTSTTFPTDQYFTAGTVGSSCTSIISGCNNTHPLVVLKTAE